jgi:hypothetical protein
VTPVARSLLFGGAVASSALVLGIDAGCYNMSTCPFNECVQAEFPDGAPCCDNGHGPRYYYSCTVGLAGEGKDALVVNSVTVGGCYTNAEDAEADAPTLAESTWGGAYPNTTPQGESCRATACPGAT